MTKTAGEPNVHMRDMAKSITLTLYVRGMRQYRWRMWLGGKLLWLVAMVIWHPIEVIEDDE